MLSFIVTGLPRSGTTWVANWLTTDNTLCIHDPLYKYTLEELDRLQTDKLLGISCTGLWEYPKFLQEHKAKKIILHRDLKDVNDSLVNEIETKPISEDKAKVLNSIDGMHIQFHDLFNPIKAKELYEYALNKPFDPVRHAYLVEMNVQPNFGMLFFNKEVLRDFKRRIA
tara:strand:+ start:55 stop:561 length:507 start_codon:yes stop_codon:yes gene_type:complete